MIVNGEKIWEFMGKWRYVILIALVFFALRLPGLSLPYHQDEWKNVSASATVESAGRFFAHPPLMQMLFVASREIFGENGMRLFPLSFSIVSGALLFAVVRRRAGKTAATWALFLFTVCFYNVLGSLMADVDGAVLPLFFLLAVYAYDKFSSFREHGSNRRRWLYVMIAACLAGLLVKLSFIIAIGALVTDYIWSNRYGLSLSKYATIFACLFGFGVIYVLLLYIIQAIYPAFSVSFMLAHAGQYGAGARLWTQIAVQGMKAVFYLSPLFVIPIASSRSDLGKTRVFLVYLVLGLIFYFLIFDFSRAALDKYLMFAIVPLSAIVGVIFAKIFKESETWTKPKNRYRAWPLAAGIFISAALVSLNFLPHAILPLYPKGLWFARVFHGDWLFLNPFNGGSGPMGFYVSFLFIAASFAVSAVLAIAAIFKEKWRPGIAVILVAIGIFYNFVFAEELLFGEINGNAPAVLKETVSFIESSPNIKQVMTYNDIGAQYLSEMGKYGGRIYATPDFEDTYKKKFGEFGGQYMVIDIPHIYENGFYGRFFAQCTVLFEAHSGKITGKVYDCQHGN